MKPKMLAVLGIVTSALLVLVFLDAPGDDDTDVDNQRDDVAALITLPQHDWVHLSWTSDIGTTALTLRDGLWWVTQPLDAPADPLVTQGFLDQIRSMRVTDAVATGDLAGFGLSPPLLELTIRSSDGQERWAVGPKAPLGSGHYLTRVDGPATDDREVNIVTKVPFDTLTEPGAHLVNLDLFEAGAGSIDTIKYETGDGPIRWLRKGSSWYVETAKQRVRADSQEVEAWLDRLASARAVAAIELPEDGGLRSGPTFTITHGADETIYIGGPRVGLGGVVRRQDLNVGFQVAAWFFEPLERDLGSWQGTHPFEVHPLRVRGWSLKVAQNHWRLIPAESGGYNLERLQPEGERKTTHIDAVAAARKFDNVIQWEAQVMTADLPNAQRSAEFRWDTTDGDLLLTIYFRNGGMWVTREGDDSVYSLASVTQAQFLDALGIPDHDR